MNEQLLTEREAAERLSMSRRYLEARRQRGGGPPFIRISSRAIRYRTKDLDEWVDARLANSTAEYREVGVRRRPAGPVHISHVLVDAVRALDLEPLDDNARRALDEVWKRIEEHRGRSAP